MKRPVTIRCGQYAYTLDGRVIQIDAIYENGKKYRGHDIDGNDHMEVKLDQKEIYGFLLKVQSQITEKGDKNG